MKTFLKLNLVLLFSLLSISFITLLFIRTNGITKEEIKTQLAKSGVYSEAITELTKQIDNSLANGAPDEANALIAPIIKKEITPQYLQTKTEKFIDDTNEWITGRNPNPPIISFRDLKEKMIAQNAGTITMLEQLNKEYEAQKEEIKKQATINGEIPQDQEMPSFDFNKIIKNDFSIPVGKNLTFLKTFYWYSMTGLPIIGAILIIFLVLIILLTDTKPLKLRWVGLTFLSSAIWNIFILIALSFSSKMLTSFLAQNKELPPFLLSLTTSLISPFLDKYIKFGKITVIILLLILIASLIASYSTKNSK